MGYQVTTQRKFIRKIPVLTPRENVDGESPGNKKQILKCELIMPDPDQLEACKDDRAIAELVLVRGFDIFDSDNQPVPDDQTREILLRDGQAITAIARVVSRLRVDNFQLS